MDLPTKNRNYAQILDNQLTWPHMVAQTICITLIWIYCLTRYRLEIKGQENRPKGFQSYIAACNHTSSLDPPLVSVALFYQPISYMAKAELFEGFWWRTYNWLMASFSVNREKLELSTVKSALKVLKTGKWALGIFPEGGRKKDGSIMNEPKRGVAYFATSAKVPVLPLAIVQTPPPEGKKGKTRINVRIGKLVPCNPDMDAMAVEIQQAIQALVEQAQQDAQQ